MTTNQLLSRLIERTGLDRATLRGVVDALADVAAEGLAADGVAHLGALGELRLGVHRARVAPDGRNLPEAAGAFFKAGQSLRHALTRVPIQAAREAARCRGIEVS